MEGWNLENANIGRFSAQLVMKWFLKKRLLRRLRLTEGRYASMGLTVLFKHKIASFYQNLATRFVHLECEDEIHFAPYIQQLDGELLQAHPEISTKLILILYHLVQSLKSQQSFQKSNIDYRVSHFHF